MVVIYVLLGVYCYCGIWLAGEMVAGAYVQYVWVRCKATRTELLLCLVQAPCVVIAWPLILGTEEAEHYWS